MKERKEERAKIKIWRKSGNFTVKQEGDSMKKLLITSRKFFKETYIGSGTGDRGSSGHCRAVYLVSLQHRAAWQRICGLCVLALKKS
jgi:hypothetical protein